MDALRPLPWGDVSLEPVDPTRAAAANLALLAAARALERAGRARAGADAEAVVTEALLSMSAPERIAAANTLRRTEERALAVIRRLKASGTAEVTGEDVRRAFAEEVKENE